MKIALVIALACSGCLWANPNSYKVSAIDAQATVVDGHTSGGTARAFVGGAGLYIGAEAGERGVSRNAMGDPNDYTGLSGDLMLRLSLPGMLPTEHVVDRYFDFGLEAGGGGVLAVGVPRGVQGIGEGFIGGWVELGTIALDDDKGYLALVGGIRSYGLDSGWDNQTIYTVSLGWRARERFAQHDFTWRD